MNVKKYILLSLSAFVIAGSLNGCRSVKRASASADVNGQSALEESSLSANKETDFFCESNNSGLTVMGYLGADTVVVIPEQIDGQNVTIIGMNAFKGNSAITSVTIPETVTLVGENAFSGCVSLTEAVLPETLECIDIGAFSDCTSLAEITVPRSVRYILNDAFLNCTSLECITVLNPDLAYENWGIDNLPNVVIKADSASAVGVWAGEMGKFSALE